MKWGGCLSDYQGREGEGEGERGGKTLQKEGLHISCGSVSKKHSFKHPPNFVSELLLPEQTSKKKVEP